MRDHIATKISAPNEDANLEIRYSMFPDILYVANKLGFGNLLFNPHGAARYGPPVGKRDVASRLHDTDQPSSSV